MRLAVLVAKPAQIGLERGIRVAGKRLVNMLLD